MKKNRVFDWLYNHFYEVELWLSGWNFCMALILFCSGSYLCALLDFVLGILFIGYYCNEREEYERKRRN